MFFLINSGAAASFTVDCPSDKTKGVKVLRELVSNKKLVLKTTKGKASFSLPIAKGSYAIVST